MFTFLKWKDRSLVIELVTGSEDSFYFSTSSYLLKVVKKCLTFELVTRSEI